jgi:hypothetical protein
LVLRRFCDYLTDTPRHKEADMATTDRTTAKRPPMTTLRKTAMYAGLFYLLSFISIPTLFLYGSLRGPNFAAGPGPANSTVILGAMLELIVALAGIATAVTLYPVVKRQGQARALGFVGSRTLEGSIIYIGIISLMSLVTLRQAGGGAAALASGPALVAQYYWTFQLGQSLMPAVNGFLIASLLYQSRLVPRWLPVLGLVGSTLLLVSTVGTAFSIWGPVASMTPLLGLPIAVWEFALGIYLTFWGFKPSPITVDM